MPKRTGRIVNTRFAGVGGDGNEYGVTQVNVSGDGAYRRKPCATCPWRWDAEVGKFPAQAFRESAHTAYDGDLAQFACHEAAVAIAPTCAGFLLRNAYNNAGARLAIITGRMDPEKVGNPDNVPLYDSYREMAIANGVDPHDPVLARCRADDEEYEREPQA